MAEPAEGVAGGVAVMDADAPGRNGIEKEPSHEECCWPVGELDDVFSGPMSLCRWGFRAVDQFDDGSTDPAGGIAEDQ